MPGPNIRFQQKELEVKRLIAAYSCPVLSPRLVLEYRYVNLQCE